MLAGIISVVLPVALWLQDRYGAAGALALCLLPVVAVVSLALALALA